MSFARSFYKILQKNEIFAKFAQFLTPKIEPLNTTICDSKLGYDKKFIKIPQKKEGNPKKAPMRRDPACRPCKNALAFLSENFALKRNFPVLSLSSLLNSGTKILKPRPQGAVFCHRVAKNLRPTRPEHFLNAQVG